MMSLSVCTDYRTENLQHFGIDKDLNIGTSTIGTMHIPVRQYILTQNTTIPHSWIIYLVKTEDFPKGVFSC